MPVDYLTFALVACIALAIVRGILARFVDGAKLPRSTWWIFLGVLALGWIPVDRAGEKERHRIERFFETVARTYAQEIAHLGHEKITLATAPDDPAYISLIEAQKRWMRADPFVRSIYTMRKLANGSTVLIVDAEADYDRNGRIEGTDEVRTEIGEVYPEKDPGLDLALAGKTNFNSDPVTNRWGTWVGAWAPVYDSQGNVEAALGIDYDAAEWLAGIRGAWRARLGQIALFLASVLAGMTAIGLLQGDLRQRRIAEDRMRKDEERWQMMLTQMPTAFVELNTSAEVTGWNPAAEQTFGYTVEQAVGRKFFDLIIPSDARSDVAAVWQELIHASGGSHHINENVTVDGRIITCEWHNRAVVDAQGKVVAVVSLGRDISNRLVLEEQVRQAQKLTSIGQLAAGVAHDFNNLLTVVQGHTDLLLDRDDLPEEAMEDIRRINAAGERAADLTRQLLTFSRKQAIFPKSMDLNAAVVEIARLFGRLLGEKIRIETDPAPNLPAIEADPSMINQLLTNLALNARDAMPNGGSLRFATAVVEISEDDVISNPERRIGPAVALTVSDTGCGISVEQLPHVFDPFFTTKEVGKGTGLGLSAVHGIVKQHSGWIELQSEPGAGTTFRIFFPPTSLPAAETSSVKLVEAETPRPGLGRTILVVEDDPSVRLLAKIALSWAGFEVLEAPDGIVAERVWAEHRDQITALVTDMVMPNGLGGRELAARFRAEKPELGIVYQTGYSIDLSAPGFCDSEREILLQKPYVPKKLIAALERVLSAGQVPSPTVSGPAV